VKWYVKEKGFGRIAPCVAPGQPPAEEVFCHRKQIEGGADGPHAQAIAEGALVTFELTQGLDGKPCAAGVQVEGVARAMARIDMSPEAKSQRDNLLRRLLTSGLQVGCFQEKGEGKSVMKPNAGDSRAVLGKKDGRAVRLSEDHQPNVLTERKRIEREGAAVTQVQGIWRIVLPSKRGTGFAGLSVSRGFGDLEYKQPAAVVSAVPDVTFRTVDLREDCLIVIGSDGIWNPIQDAEAARTAAAGLLKEGGDSNAARLAAQQVVEEAHRRDGHDDKTALVVWLGDMPDGAVAASKAPSRRPAHAMAPVHLVKSSGDDMFAGTDAKKAPQSELADLDDLFSEYAREMDTKK